MHDINNILKSFIDKKIVVIGDIMLDHYIWGKVNRISPEAPVPIVDVDREEYRLGGAANVALNIKALGAEPIVIGITGNDLSGEKIRDILIEHEIGTDGIIIDQSRLTTVKTRIGAINQQIVRIDSESKEDISQSIEDKVIEQVRTFVPDCDGIIFEDYNKGLITLTIIKNTILLAKKHNKITAVDPKYKNFFNFVGVDIFKPNYNEVQRNLGIEFDNDDHFFKEAWKLKNRLNIKGLVITRGSKGLYIFNEDSPVSSIPTFAKEVYDVSGAGDTVISVLTLALIAGCDIIHAATIANHAAGIVCAKIGTASVYPHEIIESYHATR